MVATRSLQEQILKRFLSHSLGAASVFHPDLYGQSKEPADIVFLIGRCAILMYLTAGKASLEKAIRHNIQQARKQVRIWRNGQHIRGSSDHNTFDIAYEDIDDFMILSVVDGPEAMCVPGNIQEIDELKLRGLVTLTGRAILYLATEGGGARELISLAQFTLRQSRILTTDEAISAVSAMKSSAYSSFNSTNESQPEPRRWIIDGRSVSSSEALRRQVVAMRGQPDKGLGIFAEFSWVDLARLSESLATAAEKILAAGSAQNRPTVVTAEHVGTRPRYCLLMSLLGTRNYKYELDRAMERWSTMEIDVVTLISVNDNFGLSAAFMLFGDRQGEVVRADLQVLKVTAEEGHSP